MIHVQVEEVCQWAKRELELTLLGSWDVTQHSLLLSLRVELSPKSDSLFTLCNSDIQCSTVHTDSL